MFQHQPKHLDVDVLEQRLAALELFVFVAKLRGVKRVTAALAELEVHANMWFEIRLKLAAFSIPYQSQTALASGLTAPLVAYVQAPPPDHEEANAAVRPYPVVVLIWDAEPRAKFEELLEWYAMSRSVGAIVVVTQKKKFKPLPDELRGKPVAVVQLKVEAKRGKKKSHPIRKAQ